MNFIVLAIIAVGFPLAGAVAQSLQNPSFEEAGSSPDRAAGWNRWGDWINRETEWRPAHGGSCLIGYHHWQIGEAKSSGLWQDVVGIKAGQKVTFGVWVWVDPATAPASSIELRLETAGEKDQVAFASATFPLSELPLNRWKELKVSGTVPKDGLRVLLIANPSAAAPRDGSVKLDDASLEVVDPSLP
ncbi:MAG TPA: hypothetical protein VIM58_01705 [Candidatus Methylacidiphilales bacterium]